MLRFILSWAASSRFNTIASLDVTAAFLNADLPPGRVVVLRPPTVLHKLGLIPTGFLWRVHRAVYGLREAAFLWSQERTKVMETMTFRSRGESYKVSSLRFIVLFYCWWENKMSCHHHSWHMLVLVREFKPRMSWLFVESMLMTTCQQAHMTLSPHSWNTWEVYGRWLIQCSWLQKMSLAFWESPLSSPLLGYSSIRRPTLKPSWKSTRMSLPRGKEPQQESQSISTKMLSHLLTWPILNMSSGWKELRRS